MLKVQRTMLFISVRVLVDGSHTMRVALNVQKLSYFHVAKPWSAEDAMLSTFTVHRGMLSACLKLSFTSSQSAPLVQRGNEIYFTALCALKLF